jgi:hypothetical protein
MVILIFMDVPGGFAPATVAAPRGDISEKRFNRGMDPWSEILDFSSTL